MKGTDSTMLPCFMCVHMVLLPVLFTIERSAQGLSFLWCCSNSVGAAPRQNLQAAVEAKPARHCQSHPPAPAAA